MSQLPFTRVLWLRLGRISFYFRVPPRVILSYANILTSVILHRELAFQISEQFEALGSTIGVKCAVIVGGMDMMSQSIALSKKPHIIICTPGRLVDHLENTKGFNLKNLKFLVCFDQGYHIFSECVTYVYGLTTGAG